MRDADPREARLAKIFMILALTFLILGNTVALFFYFSANSEMRSYSPEMIQDGLSALAFLSMRLAATVGCILAAGIGDLLSIVFSSFSLSFAAKTARVCRQPHDTLRILSAIILIISIIALILTLPTYFLLSFFLGL